MKAIEARLVGYVSKNFGVGKSSKSRQTVNILLLVAGQGQHITKEATFPKNHSKVGYV